MFCKGYSTGSTDITCNFYSGTGSGIRKLKSDAGCKDTSSNVTLNVMKALLSMDQFVLVKGGNSLIQSVQRTINSKYEDYIGLAPCDGLYGRQMNTALIKVLQAIEGQTPEQANGNFGPTTTAKLPIIPTDTSLSDKTKEEGILLGKYALVCNGYNISIGNSTWSNTLVNTIKNFQADMCIEQTGNLDKNTWMALLLSKGNPDRACNACDTVYSMLRAGRLDTLRNNNITAIGRYITGGSDKILDAGEIEAIINGGFKFIPIYQEDGTPGVGHFTQEKAYAAARKARVMAKSFKIPEDSIIYFAVDFDAVDTEILNVIVPYFKILKENLQYYKVGIYGTRNVCKQVMNSNYAETCFVSDMSTGFSGNMGFKMPDNWNLDQFNEITLSASTGNFGIDKVTYSGRYPLVTNLYNGNTKGLVSDFKFNKNNTWAYRKYDGEKMKVYLSATKASEDIPEDALVLLKVWAQPATEPPYCFYSGEVHAKLDGKIYGFESSPDSIEHLIIQNGAEYGFEFSLVRKDGDIYIQLENGEANVHIEVETE